MAVLFDNASSSLVTASTSVTTSLVVTSGACLIVGVTLSEPSGGNLTNLSVSAVFANGVQMTQLQRVVANAGNISPVTVHLFALTSSPAGTVSISANIVGSTARMMGIGAMSFVGHRSSNPFGAISVGTAGNVTNTTFTVSHSSIDRVVLIGGCTNSIQANMTPRITNGGNIGFYMGDTAGPNTSFSDGFSFSASMSTAATYVQGFIGLNIAAPRATMLLSLFNRLLKDVGF